MTVGMTAGTATLDGKWALITGAGRRVGACIARTLHTQGANVVIHYKGSAAPASALAQELNAARAGSAFTKQCDLLENDALARMVSEIIARTRRLDVLVNNASSFYPTPVGSITIAQWEDLIGTNLRAPLFLSQAAVPHLRATQGAIVNLLDIHGVRPLRDHPVYGAAKAGLAMVTRSLARDLAPDVRVNGVAPGAVLWPDDGLADKTRESIIRQIPMKRPGAPEDIASCVLYLVRDAPYVTGQIITVDGGRSIGW
jgi:pteridine reductase